MNIKLLFQALFKMLLGLILVWLLLFISAGSIKYYNGWLLIGLLFIPMFFACIFLSIKNPTLLKNRLSSKEKEVKQKKVVLYSALMFISGFVVAGLNYRFKWMSLSKTTIIISSVLFLLSYILYAEVLRENTYLLRTIEVKKDQKLIDNGLYKIIRHPMYAVTIILFLTMPLILNSPISFVIFFIYPLIIIKRIKNEEEVLERDLKGYKEYKQRVKYRLIPYLW